MTAIFAIVASLVPTAAALAQAAAPPQPALNRTTPVWIGYLIMFIMLAALVSVSLMPSKRSHQD